MTFLQRLWRATHDGPDSLFSSMTPFTWRDNTHCVQNFIPYIPTDGLDRMALQNRETPFTALLNLPWQKNISLQPMTYQCFNPNQLPVRLNPSDVVVFEQASMATQVTPFNLSTLTDALSSLAPDDLRKLQTNIASLLEDHDAPDDDDDAKMDSIPNLSDADIDDDFSLGSNDSVKNIINSQFDNY